MKKVLVTGASGALGRELVARLAQDDRYRIVAASRHPSGEGELQLDLRDKEQIGRAIGQVQPDVILHLAATFANDFDDAYAINVDAARHLLDAVQE